MRRFGSAHLLSSLRSRRLRCRGSGLLGVVLVGLGLRRLHVHGLAMISLHVLVHRPRSGLHRGFSRRRLREGSRRRSGQQNSHQQILFHGVEMELIEAHSQGSGWLEQTGCGRPC